jgi:hypothetical protein
MVRENSPVVLSFACSSMHTRDRGDKQRSII